LAQTVARARTQRVEGRHFRRCTTDNYADETWCDRRPSDNGRAALTPQVARGAPKTEYVTGTGPCGAPPATYHQPLIEHHQNHVQHHQLVAASNGQLRGQSGAGAMAVATITAPPVQSVNPLSTVYATKRRRRNGKR